MRGLSQRVGASERDAGAAGRDVGEIRGELRDFRQATTASFNALREDFVDLRNHVDRGFAEMRGKFDAAAAGQQQIIDLLHTLSGQEGPGNA